MSYSIEYKKKAKKFLDEHPKEKTKFDEAFKDIANKDYKSYENKKMVASSEIYRLRLGKYRALFTVINDKLVILVLDIDSRGQIYK